MRVSGVSSITARSTKTPVARVIPFETFYRDHYRGMLGVALALAGDTGTAEDLVQEAFLSAHRRWDRISQYDMPQAWVRRVLINRATSLRRRLGAESRALDRIGSSEPHQPDLSPETEGVWREVRNLPRRQQQAVALFYVAQLSIGEVADAMGCSRGAVKSHLHRARAALEGPLADWNEEKP